MNSCIDSSLSLSESYGVIAIGKRAHHAMMYIEQIDFNDPSRRNISRVHLTLSPKDDPTCGDTGRECRNGTECFKQVFSSVFRIRIPAYAHETMTSLGENEGIDDLNEMIKPPVEIDSLKSFPCSMEKIDLLIENISSIKVAQKKGSVIDFDLKGRSSSVFSFGHNCLTWLLELLSEIGVHVNWNETINDPSKFVEKSGLVFRVT